MTTIRGFGIFLALCLLSLQSFSQSMAPALGAYLKLKDALVATEPAAARREAGKLAASLEKVDPARLSATDKRALTAARTHATAISRASVVTQQRAQFEKLSASMISLAKSARSTKVYVQYCPMAANGKGASWLSDKPEIRNPYYGNKMLTCGSVKETF